MRFSLALVSLFLLVADAHGGDDYYEPTTHPLPFDFRSDQPFSDYLEATAAYLNEQRTFIKPERKAWELDLVMPFELAPEPSCAGPVRGILLVHGILDTPYAVRDIGEALNGHCFLVRSVLLPGHGTRPGELLTVRADDWLAAVDYGVRSLRRDSDEVYVGGFSLGGLLATHAALDNRDIEAVILLAPALRVTYPLLADQSSWLRHLRDWLDQNPAPLPIRYQSMPTNAVAQVMALIDSYDRKIRGGLETPAYVVTSVDDIAVQGEDVNEEFLEHFLNPSSRLEVYGDYEQPDDDRVLVLDSFIADRSILNIAHVAIPFREDDFYFGVDGAYRDCGQYLPIVPNRQVAQCSRAKENWKGELESTNDKRYLPLQRLTFNPFFDDTMARILRFLEDVQNNRRASE